MKLKNVSTRPYGVAGRIYAPLDEFTITDAVQLASIASIIKSGDFKVLDDVTDVEVKVKEDTEEKPRRGRPSKVTSDDFDIQPD